MCSIDTKLSVVYTLSMGNGERQETSEEQALLRHLVGATATSVLMTDAYKFAMAQAGDPLREETFYLSFRRPGAYLVPFDLERLVRAMVPSPPTNAEEKTLALHGYELSEGMRRALGGALKIWAAPKGSWIREREPIVRITGPSFLVSWLESLVIWMQFPIQVATAVMDGCQRFVCSCDDEAAIVRKTLCAIGCLDRAVIEVDPEYKQSVRRNALALAGALKGSLERVYEVGMRGATCMQMHRIALGELTDLQIAGTSNVYLAGKLGLLAVGTTGHEYQLRFENDAAAFRALRDLRPAAPSYLFDTIDALDVGIPAVVEVLRESPNRRASVRFDSGDVRAQVSAFFSAGVRPGFVFMDGMDDRKVADLCALQAELDPHGSPWRFGVGGFLVARPASTPLTRDRVSAVYKLCETGGRPVMKFSVPGKESLPGKPVSWRLGPPGASVSVIAQEGERLADWQALGPRQTHPLSPPPGRALLSPPLLSPATEALISDLRNMHVGRAKLESVPSIRTIRNSLAAPKKGTQL